MWKPTANFITIHYLWILLCSLLAFPILYPYGNLAAVDVLFIGCSGSTESGLNPLDVKDMAIYQQIYIYIIPFITNMCFINVMVIVSRLYWFHKRIKSLKPNPAHGENGDPEIRIEDVSDGEDEDRNVRDDKGKDVVGLRPPQAKRAHSTPAASAADPEPERTEPPRATTIMFDDRVDATRAAAGPAPGDMTLRIPGPRERDSGQPMIEIPASDADDHDADTIKPVGQPPSSALSRRKSFHAEGLAMARSLEKAATTVLVLGQTRSAETRRRASDVSTRPRGAELPQLSRHVTVGRNSQFHNLTERDREVLGGIEYRSLKVLLKITTGYFLGLHLLGVICLLPWIHANAGTKYTDWLDQNGQGWSWWAIYSAQTMANNLGFTLTPDSMITFKDATWPMLVMTFLAFAGNTCYPIFLRLVIWAMSRAVPKNSAAREHLQFLLDHPRRCYTLLFPSKPTWVLFGILAVLNFVDVLLIIVLDLNNPAVNDLPVGPRVLSSLFQAASARHTGTSTYNLGLVNPAVQFSLLCMMYIAVFPIAISIRASNTYEERALGIYAREEHEVNELSGTEYVLAHVRNQLSFDLWYMFLGTFCICVAESPRVMDPNEPAFSVFPLFFEVVSAYGNVGLSLGHPSVSTSLSGQFSPFSKVVICAMMLRGRHRGLPNSLDRAIMLSKDGAHPIYEGSSHTVVDGGAVERVASAPAGPPENKAATVPLVARGEKVD